MPIVVFGMGLADRDYMRRTPAELNRDYGVGGRDTNALVWIVAVFVASIALRQLAVWLGIGFVPF